MITRRASEDMKGEEYTRIPEKIIARRCTDDNRMIHRKVECENGTTRQGEKEEQIWRAMGASDM